MIEVGLEFDVGALDRVAAAFQSLRGTLRPLYFVSDETEAISATNLIGDQKKFCAFVASHNYGFFLKGPGVSYNIRTAPKKPIVCEGFLNVQHALVSEFLIQMAAAKPVFGFACAPAEREWRNRIVVKLGNNTIESWVGRDANKYVPGLYWLTLISQALVERHGISVFDLARHAAEYVRLDGDVHLFRFYKSPDDWRVNNHEIDKISASFPGIFNIEKVRPRLRSAKNFGEHSAILADWQ